MIQTKITNLEQKDIKTKRQNNNNYNKMNSKSHPKSPNKKFKSQIFSITKINDTFPQDYKTRRFILLDTETTGLEIESDRLIAINAVEMINCELTGIQFNAYLDKRFIYNSKPLMYYLSDYNYSRKDNIKKSLKTFLDFVGDDMIITHNANFDMKFINRELNKYGLDEIPLNRCICTLKYFRSLKKFGMLDKNFGLKLCDLCSYYDIYVDQKDLHQGIVDTIVFGRVVAKMFEDGVYNFNDIRNNFDEINNLGRSFIDLNLYDLNNNNNPNENNFDNINIIDNNLDKSYIKKYKRKLCKSDDKRRNNKLNINPFLYNKNKINFINSSNINNFAFNKYKNQINNSKHNNINKNKTKKNNVIKKFKFMNSQDFNECANRNTPPKKLDSEPFPFNKSKSYSINYQEDEIKLNFLKNAFKSYISSNKIK